MEALSMPAEKFLSKKRTTEEMIEMARIKTQLAFGARAKDHAAEAAVLINCATEILRK